VTSSLTAGGARRETPTGPVACEWRRSGERVRLELTVPPSSVGRLVLDRKQDAQRLDPGTHVIDAVVADPAG
jgi:hypothetical protein